MSGLRDHSAIEILYGESSLPDYLEDVEADALTLGLEAAGWNHKKAAALLGISRPSLIDRIRRRSISREEWERVHTRFMIERARLYSRQRFLDYFFTKDAQ